MQERLNIINEMKEILESEKINKEYIVAALRFFCKNYGGQLYYFPSKMLNERTKLLYDIFFTAIKNEEYAEKITRVVVDCFGGIAEYIPKELTAFRNEITEEIFLFYKSAGRNRMNEICMKYNISFTQAYRLIKEYKLNRYKKQKSVNKTDTKKYDDTTPSFL